MKKLIAMLLVCSMVLGLVACGGGDSGTSKEGGSGDSQKAGTDTLEDGEMPVLQLVTATWGATPTDTLEVQEEINKITREKIGAEIEMQIIPGSNYMTQVNLMLSGSEQVDMLGTFGWQLMSAYSSEQVRPLQELVDSYGTGIKEAIGEELLNCGQIDGELYTIPIQADYAYGMGGFILRKDICDQYGINVEDIDSYEKLTEAFQLVHEKEPDMTILSTYSTGGSFLSFNETWDGLGDNFGALMNSGQTLEVTNLFESEEYRAYLDVVHDWFQRGFISNDITNATEAGAAMMKGGNLFAYSQCGKPGIEAQEGNSSGYEVAYCQVLPTITRTPTMYGWTIPENSAYPEKAMEFINLMYTDPDLINLLGYGIEGKHYVKQEDGTINYPDGVNASNSGYNMGNMVWTFGNEFNAYVWDGNSLDVWEKTAEWNQSGTKSKAFGFVFNTEEVANEIAACRNAYQEYSVSLECGVADPDETLPKLNEALYAAGLQKIMDAKQEQLNKWAGENGVK